jgi:hypothetical protein
VLKILGEKAAEPVVLGIRPEVGIEPGELVGRGASESGANQRLGRVENLELTQHVLGFAPRDVRSEQWGSAAKRTARGGYELDESLVGDADRVGGDALSKDVGGAALLLGKSGIEAVDEYVRVNERGARRAPPSSNRETRRCRIVPVVFPVGDSWPGRRA